jgi:hypothetical protein
MERQFSTTQNKIYEEEIKQEKRQVNEEIKKGMKE